MKYRALCNLKTFNLYVCGGVSSHIFHIMPVELPLAAYKLIINQYEKAPWNLINLSGHLLGFPYECIDLWSAFDSGSS